MNYPEIFTPEERDENEERKRELIDLVALGEAILIVGAGSSARVCYVTWDGLMDELENLANQCGNGLNQRHKNDPLAYAEDIKSHIRDKRDNLDRYHNLLYELFKSKSPSFDDFHKILVSLPFRGILTTNYDTVLEAALNDKDPTLGHDNALVIGSGPAIRVHEFLMAMNNDKRFPRRIAHLHGKFDIPESIVLSTEDYHKVYGLRPPANQVQRDSEWTLHRKLLWAVLATRRVVFVGFSMEDPYFNKMLEIVSADLWGWNKSIHFAIMGITTENTQNTKDSKDKAKRLKAKYGVDTVFYEVFKDPHKRLEDLFVEIAGQCENRSRSIEETQDPSGDSERATDEESTSISSGARDILNWLKRESQRMIKGMDDED